MNCINRKKENRLFERTEITLPVKYLCENILYNGTIKNISENGMFISTCNFLPCSHIVELLIPLKKEVSKFYAKIRRIEREDDSSYNIGVELLNPPEKYLEFIKSLRSSI